MPKNTAIAVMLAVPMERMVAAQGNKKTVSTSNIKNKMAKR